MSFIIKSQPEITADLIDYLRGATDLITDFNVGSVVRTMLESVAFETDDLYQAMYYNILSAIPQAIYLSFDFNLLPAVYATGTVTFTLDSVQSIDVTIPGGTQVRVPSSSVTYATTADLTIVAGQTQGSVVVKASVAGTIGNTLAGSVTEIIDTLTGVTVSNAAAFTNGRDVESEADRKQRFVEYINSLARGTEDAILYAVKQATVLDSEGGILEYVVSANITNLIPGLAKVYISSGSGVTSDQLVTNAQAIVDGYIDSVGNKISGYRAAGIEVRVYKVTTTVVNFNITVSLSAGYTLDSNMIALINQAIDKALLLVIPGTTFYISTIINSILDITGVIGVRINTPATDIVVGSNETLIRGTTTIA